MGTVSANLVAGVDSSTQSTKVQVRDAATGALVAHASAPHPPTTPPVSEQQPEVWWQALAACWAELGEPEVAAISVAGQQHGMVVLDHDRRVIRPAKLWNDTQSAPDAAWLVDQLPGGPAEWAARSGSVPVASFTITKLRWLQRCEPESWDRLAHVLLPHDWMTGRLTGELVTDRGDASGTGYWSPGTDGYDLGVLAILDAARDWSTVLPRVAQPAEQVGTWRGALVGCGTGDNMAAALGLGLGPGVASLSIGTSGVVAAVSDRPTHDATGTIAGFADAAGGFLPLVCTLNAAKPLDAVARLLGVDHHALDRLAIDGRSGDLTVLPYFDGERTPNLPGASGVISGLRSDVDGGALARAVFEGVACGLLDGLDALRAAVPVERVVLTGGGARSTTLAGLIAALAGVPVFASEQDEAVAAGACVQAAAALHGEPPAAVIARWGLGDAREVSPVGADPGLRERYAELRHRTYGV